MWEGLAAKAAGIEVQYDDARQCWRRLIGIAPNQLMSAIWQPMHNDEQAFYLQVRLCMGVDVDKEVVSAVHINVAGDVFSFSTDVNNAPRAATRAAIVGLAAKIAQGNGQAILELARHEVEDLPDGT